MPSAVGAAMVSCLTALAAAGQSGEAPSPAEAPAASKMPRIRVAADGRTFETVDGRPFVPLGVTYYRPGTGWAPQVWKQFDAEATRADFARMKQLGVNCVRVFLSFGSFLTKPDALDPDGLAKFDQFLEIAESAGVYVHPTGPDHWEGLPDWARGDHIAEPRLLAALERFWELLAARYRARTVIFAYDLRNEPQVAWETPPMRDGWNGWLAARYGSRDAQATAWGVPAETIGWGRQSAPDPKTGSAHALVDYQSYREEVADEWTRRQVAAIRRADPDAMVTVGLIQWSVPALLPGVRHYAAFRPERQAKLLDFLEIHFYPLADGFYHYASQEAEDRNLAYLESVVREAAAPGKPVVIGEFGWYGGGRLTIGGDHPAATEAQQARWCRQVVETTRGWACGWLNWGFYDQPEARDVSQLTGLVTADGTTKAWGEEFSRLAAEWSARRIPPPPAVVRPALDWRRATIDLDAGRQFREEYLRAFLDQRPGQRAGD